MDDLKWEDEYLPPNHDWYPGLGVRADIPGTSLLVRIQPVVQPAGRAYGPSFVGEIRRHNGLWAIYTSRRFAYMTDAKASMEAMIECGLAMTMDALANVHNDIVAGSLPVLDRRAK